MSLPITVPEVRSRWKLTAIVAVVALVLSMLSLGQQSIAHAEDGSTNSISGVVTLPEGSTATFADVAVQATLDGAEDALEPVAVAEDGSYALADLEPGAYRVEFVVSGDSADVVSGQVFGATAEEPEGELVDVAAGGRDDVDVTLEAVAAEVAPVEAVAVKADVPAVDEAEAAAEKAAVEAIRAEEAAQVSAHEERKAAAVEQDESGEEGVSMVETELVEESSPAPAAQVLSTTQALETRAVATRSISGVVTMQNGYGAYLSALRVEACIADESMPCAPWVRVNSSTGAWTISGLTPGKYNVRVTSYDTTSFRTFDNYYPNTEDSKRQGSVDVTKGNVAGVKSLVRPSLRLIGKLALPSGFSYTGSRLYLYNAKGQMIDWDVMTRPTDDYYFWNLPAGNYWISTSTVDAKWNLNMVQFTRNAGKTKLTPVAGRTNTLNLTATTAKSTISGKISVTGGLPKDFERAAFVSQRVDGIWFDTYYAWLNYENYTGIKLAQGEYTVEFSAKTGRDIAKGEWWNKKPTRAKANIIKLNGTNQATGINGRLTTGSSGQVSPFKDVLSNHKFYSEIAWMYSSGTSTGTRTPAGRYYKPKDSVSREAMAAFMFRMNSPKGYKAPKKSPFKDISTKHKFYKEIAWMYTSGLSTGNKVAGGREYRPKDAVSRAAMAAFMYRQYAPKGKDAKKYYAFFADVRSNYKFYNEIAWMKDSGISTGTRVGSVAYYKPNENVTREAMAAFLFRNALYR